MLYKNRTQSLFFVVFILIIIFFVSCRKGKNIPDVSDIDIELNIRHFEQDFFNIDTNNVTAELQGLENKYPEFMPIFLQIIGAGDPHNVPEGKVKYLEGMLKHPAPKKLYDTCRIVYNDFEPLAAEFEQAFRYYKYYFPEKPTPGVTTFVSEYVLAAFIYGNDQLAVGLDMFLGSAYPYRMYNPGNSNFSDYLIRTYNKEHLVAKTMNALVEDLVGSASGQRLLDIMVHNGKKLYVLSQLLPYAPDSVIIEYSQPQINWVESNEFEMWNHLLKEDLLYSTDVKETRKLVEYSPHSPGMPPAAPGRTANWLGWQIVAAYMNRNSDVGLEGLLKMKDAQTILDKSKYKPRG